MYVAVMGYGVVGSGVVELFGKNHGSIVRRSTQTEMEIRYILDLRDFPGDPNEKNSPRIFKRFYRMRKLRSLLKRWAACIRRMNMCSPASRRGRAIK
mgnify:CR=1 FL=1